MSKLTPWHRLFGMTLADRLYGLPLTVVCEKNLAEQRQLLDVLLLCPDRTLLTRPLPDGFEELAPHNLITFKSFQQTLSDYALRELIGHGINYHKLLNLSTAEFVPESDIQLFAVSVRFPQALANQLPFHRVRPGVYDVTYGTQRIRTIVIHELPETRENAMFLILSAQEKLVTYGLKQFQSYNPQTNTILFRLWERYQQEWPDMPITLEEFTAQTINDILESTPIEKLLERVPTEKRLEGIPTEKRLEGLSEEERRKLLQMLLNELKESPPENPK
jgi:hypothetical protein